MTIKFWDAPKDQILNGARSGVFLQMLGEKRFEALIRQKPSGGWRVIVTNSNGRKVFVGPARHPDPHTVRFFAPRFGTRRVVAMSEYSVEGTGYVDRAPNSGAIRP